MTLLRVGVLYGLLAIGGCGSGEQARSSAQAPAAEAKPVALPVPEPTEPAKRAPQPSGGACATIEACSEGALAHERNKQLDRAAPLYERACDLGWPQACHRLGELYRDGQGVSADDARAKALFEHGCREGSSAACDALGH